MTADRPHSKPPHEAGPLRRLFHTVLALTGWVVFIYWWWLVFRRVNPSDVRFTLLFTGISLASIVLLTAGWAIHNRMIYKRKGPRRKVRDVAREYTHDGVGRALEFNSTAVESQTAPVVRVQVAEGVKTYRPGTSVPGSEPAGR